MTRRAVSAVAALLVLTALASPVLGASSPAFRKSWDFYERRLREGASPKEIKFILDKMEKQYRRPDEVQRIRDARFSQNAAQDLQNSWAFYQKRVRLGANSGERLLLLDKIEKKYRDRGVDLKFLQEERARLAPVPSDENVENDRVGFYVEWNKYQGEAAGMAANDRLERIATLETKYAHVPEAAKMGEVERRKIEAEQTAPIEPPEPPAPPPEKTFPGFLRADYWPASGVYDQDEKDGRAEVPGLLAFGYDNAEANGSQAGGFGVRAGALFPVISDWFAAGASIGYVLGPRSEVTVNGQSDFAEDGRQQRIVETYFLRAMAEAQTRWRFTRLVSIRLGLAAGVAQGRSNADTGNSGSFVSALHLAPTTHSSKTWTGFTFDATPTLAVNGETVTFEIGPVFSYFPKLSKSDTFNEFNWKPVGFLAQIDF